MELSDNSLHDYGKSVYETIPFFQHISDFMENPKTRQFYEEYMNNITVKSTLFSMWVYERLDEDNYSTQEKIAILHQIMHSCETRKQLLELYDCETRKPKLLL